MNVMADGAYQGSSKIAQVKQEQSELDDIIMEGDLILEVQADGQIDYRSQKDVSKLPPECVGHDNLIEFQDEFLVKVGSTFESTKDFVKYVNEHAPRWCFSYKCTEAENTDTENEAYTYSCVYLKNKDYAKKKNIKKRINSKTHCPCKVKLRRRQGEELTVVFVCNHHDHDLNEEDFQRLQSSSKKLAPYVKEMIMDLLALEIEIPRISKMIEMETGMKLNRSYFNEIEKKMRLNNEERQITDKRLKELTDKMNLVEALYCGDEDDEEVISDQQPQGPKVKRIKMSGSDGIVCKFKDNDDNDDEEDYEEKIANLKTENTLSKYLHNEESANRASTSEWDESTAAEEAQQNYTTMEEDTTAEEYSQVYAVQENTEEGNTEGNAENAQYETVILQDEYGNILNCENDEQIVILQQDENGMIQGENGAIGYFDGEQIIYVSGDQQAETEQVESNEGNESSNVGDEQIESTGTKHVVPVFDIHMKNGNVTGYVVDDEGESSKSPQKTVRELHISRPNTSQQSESDAEGVRHVNPANATQEIVTGDIYTKHEYIHRYNIDEYMAKPQFPKYVETLAKKTRVDIMQMLTKVYSEKAMFKMTTTQKGNEGNTKIWYLTDVRRKGKYKMSDEEKMKRDKLGQYMTDILILKERCKHLKRENEELITRNKYLEEVALRLAKLKEHN